MDLFKYFRNKNFVIEKVNNIYLCNEDEFKYNSYYIYIISPLNLEWNKYDTNSVLPYINDNDIVEKYMYSNDRYLFD
jgi:hypothetical protein